MRFPHPSTSRTLPAGYAAWALRERAAAFGDLLSSLPTSRIAALGFLCAVVLFGAYVRTVLGLVRAGQEFRIQQVEQARAAARQPARMSAQSHKGSAAPLMVAAAGKVESKHNGS